MAHSIRARLGMICAVALFFAYPYLIYRGMDSGFVWVAPLLVSMLYIMRAFAMRDRKLRFVNLLIAACLVFSVFFLKSLSAKFLPVLVQVMFGWFFARTLIKGPSLIERFVRLEYPVFPPGIVEYCRQLTWLWTLFFAFNVVVCSVLAVWASDALWAFYTGVVIIGLTVFLLVGEYFYRRHRFPDLDVPDPTASFKSMWTNGRKIWLDFHAP